MSNELMLVEELSEQELELISGGALLRIDVQNVLNNNNVDVDVPVTVQNIAVNAAVAVLGRAGAAQSVVQ